MVFVVELRLAISDGESLQRAAESLESRQNRILAKIRKSKVYVIGVVKRISRNGAALEVVDELPMVHARRQD